MACEYFKKGCLIGGQACLEVKYGDTSCSEANRLRLLEKKTCPLTHGDTCDLPVCWRGILPNDIPCHIGTECIFGNRYLDVREQASSSRPSFNHEEFAKTAAWIRKECRQIKQKNAA